MERKDVEEKLQEKANEIQTPAFEEVWGGVKERIEREKREEREKKIRWRKFRPLAVTFACLAVTCGIVLPIVLPNMLQKPQDPPVVPPVYYLNDDLMTVNTSEEEFHNALQGSDVQVVNLSRFKVEMASIFKTNTGVVKGGRADFFDSQETPTCFIHLKFYNYDVEVSDAYESVYDTNYVTQSGAVIEYKYDNAFGKFYIKAEYKEVQYFMEYMGVNETVTQFFETFFQ